MENSSRHYTEQEIEDRAQENGSRYYGIYNIAPEEKQKFWYLAISFSIISFIYSMTREFKDTFILEKMDSSGLSYLKLYFVTPATILVSLIISALLKTYEVRTILKWGVLFFIFFFLIFSLVLIPFREYVEPNVYIGSDLMSNDKTTYFKLNFLAPLFLLFVYYVSTINYIVIEMWSAFILSLLFLSYVNYACPFRQFKRFIPILYIFANIALVLSGFALTGIASFTSKLSYNSNLYITSGFYFICFLLSIALLFILKRLDYYIDNPLYIPDAVQRRRAKPNVTFTETMEMILSAGVVLGLSLITLFYNFIINISEINYKSLMKSYASVLTVQYKDVAFKYQAFSQIATGAAVIFIFLSPLKRSVDIFGWTCIGLVTPIIMTIACTLIFSLSLFNICQIIGKSGQNQNSNFIINFLLKYIPIISEDRKITFLYSELLISCFFIAAFKTFKYAAFDITKETLSMRIHNDSRAKCKAVYDGMCGKLGKSSASIFVNIMLAVFNITDFRYSIGVSIPIVILFGIVYIRTIFYLGNKYNESINTNVFIEVEEAGKKNVEEGEVK